MRLSSLNDLPPAQARTVIVNVHTDLVTTRAVLSAIELAGMPVVLVNCEPTEASSHHFDKLMANYDFDTLDAPLRRHGDTLDWIFSCSRDDQLLLLDSDAELRDEGFVHWMRTMLRNQMVFGSGFTEGPLWMTERWLAPPRSILYMERPWVPCVLMRVEAVRRALAAGRRFAEQIVPNEVWFSRRASNFLAARFAPPWGTVSRAFGRLPVDWQRRLSSRSFEPLSRMRREYYGLRPKMVCYDTAALIYEYLRHEEGLLFAGLDVGLADGQVHHYLGITRSALFGATPLDALAEDVEGEVRDRLSCRYGYTWAS